MCKRAYVAARRYGLKLQDWQPRKNGYYCGGTIPAQAHFNGAVLWKIGMAGIWASCTTGEIPTLAVAPILTIALPPTIGLAPMPILTLALALALTIILALTLALAPTLTLILTLTANP